MILKHTFFELIQVALGTRICLSHTPTVEEWGKLYELVKKQELIGICFFAVELLHIQHQTPPSEILVQWFGMAEIIKKRNKVVDKQCVELAHRFDADGLEYCIMKGQQVGRYYGNMAQFRQPGDIDVWIKGGMKKVIDYVQNIAPTNSISHQHVHLHVFENTTVEMHYIPAELHDPFFNYALKYHLQYFGNFKKLDDSGCLNGISAPSDEFNIIHIIAHSFRHLFGEGLTLRQLMDLYFVLNNWNPSDEVKIKIKESIIDCGLYKYTGAIMYVLAKAFGLSNEKMICSPMENEGCFLLNFIMDTRCSGFGASESAWKRFWRIQKFNLRLWRLAPSEVFWTPIWRIFNWLWMKRHGYVYCG